MFRIQRIYYKCISRIRITCGLRIFTTKTAGNMGVKRFKTSFFHVYQYHIAHKKSHCSHRRLFFIFHSTGKSKKEPQRQRQRWSNDDVETSFMCIDFVLCRDRGKIPIQWRRTDAQIHTHTYTQLFTIGEALPSACAIRAIHMTTFAVVCQCMCSVTLTRLSIT